MKGSLLNLLGCNRGAAIAEYGLLLALVAAGTVTLLTQIGAKVGTFIGAVSHALG